jgi:hypothetical protein
MANRLVRSAGSAAIAALAVHTFASSASGQTVAGSVERDRSRELICSPHAVVQPALPSLRIMGGRDLRKALFGTGEIVILSGGTAQGMRAGQEYVARRVVKDEFALPIKGFVPVNVHTAARLRVVQVDENTAAATIVYACDGVEEGDYLEPFVPPVLPAAAAPGEPDYAQAATIVLADERRLLGSAGSMMVLDRGTAEGVRPGQRATIFRRALAGTGPILRVGEATVVVVRDETSVIRIDTSREAVEVGQLVALHK